MSIDTDEPRRLAETAPDEVFVAPDNLGSLPPTDTELWSYTLGKGRLFLQFSAVSKLFLGSALMFLALRGQWLLLLTPFAVMVVVGAVVTLVWSTQVADFDRRGHFERIDRTRRDGSVDIFITTCGEDPAVVENTIWRAIAVESVGDVNVYVLDDKGSPLVRRAAEMWGATYLHRPNRGWMKKAGNIHYAYSRSTADFIVVLDADFAVRPDFLRHTLPYFDDETVGIVQTPQFFRVSPTNWVERGAAAQQEQFYRIGMRARDRRGGAICVGTNAVYRRAALEERGGMALLEHSEDLFTGMKVLDAGYRVMYLPLVLAAGSAPSDVRSLASQQYRWARGNFALAGTPLFKRLKMTPLQRLSIWDGWIFYITSALSPVVAVIVPLLTLAQAPEAITLAPTLMLVPALITEFVLQPRWLYLADGQASRRVGLISQVAHLYALRDHLTDREQEWVPTGGQNPGKHRQATDRIPDLIAACGFWGFLATLALLGLRAADGYSLLDLFPVALLAAVALPTALAVARPPERAPRRQRVEDAGRDVFLDAVRALSILRVLFWHGLGFWWISWTFAAMPAVFYVSGAVLAKSLRRRTPWQVVRSRLRRLLPPYAMFVAIALTAVAVADRQAFSNQLGDVLSWVVPYRSPAPLPWEDGWLSAPLWFIRALILVMLIVPVGVKVARLLPVAVWGVLWAVSLVALDWLTGRQTTETATAVIRGVGDIVCFGGFLALGMVAHHRRHNFGSRELRRILVALVALTALATWFSPPADMVVNNSNTSMALVGMCWLVVLLLFEDQLRHLGSIPAMSRLMSWVTDNSMTVYLWHTLVICVAYYLVGLPTSIGEFVMMASLFGVMLVHIVSATRPFEGLADRAKQGKGFRPFALAGWMAVLLLMTTQPTLFPQYTEAIGPPAPSGRPAVGDGTDEVVLAESAGPHAAVSASMWLSGRKVDSAAVVGLGGASDGEWTQELGEEASLGVDEQFEVLSITKTMVATVTLQMVEQGIFDLDAPLPAIDGLPSSLTDHETIRRLLAHASGLVDYRQASGYTTDLGLDPVSAVMLALRDSDTSVTTVNYSATNYFVVGLLIEQKTGASLAQVLSDRLFVPLGLDDTTMIDNTRDGFVGFASGGVISTLGDLARWYDALYRRGTVLSPEMMREMEYGGMEFSRGGGLGVWRHCPCGTPTDEDPTPWLYLFHDGGDVRVVYIPGQDMVLAMRFSVPLYGRLHIVDGIDDFIFATIAGHETELQSVEGR